MSEAVDAYDPEDQENRGHSPNAIQAALQRFRSPPTFDLPPDFAAFDVFAGYLVFDALIATWTVTIETGPCWCRRLEVVRLTPCVRRSITLPASASHCLRRDLLRTYTTARSLDGLAKAKRAVSSTSEERHGNRSLRSPEPHRDCAATRSERIGWIGFCRWIVIQC